MRTLAQREGRTIRLCRDELFERDVIVKSAPTEPLTHEARLLLAVPPGTAPALIGLEWDADGRLSIVMEALAGRSLADAAESVEEGRAAALLQAACQCLIHVHRSGILHMDIRPENLFLLAGDGPPRIRLLDFGFSRNHSGALLRRDVPQGGTPAYMAPEVLRGWAFDHRADQYSLGATWRALFPALVSREPWAEILTRMCAASPADRFPDLVTARDEIGARFQLAPRDDRLPRLGGGPLRGRAGDMERLAGLLNEGAPVERILLTARAGTGLARFALETSLSIARDGPLPMRATSASILGNPLPAQFATRFRQYVAERGAAGGRLLCGVHDASPGLRWVPSELGDALRELFSGPRARRFELGPVDADAFVDSVAQALGTGGGLPGEIGRALHAQTGGDFRLADEGLREVLGRLRFREQGLACSGEPGSRWLSRWRPPRPDPRVALLPGEWLRALRICARVGASFPESVARGMLAALGEADALDRLIDLGLLQRQAGPRLAFLTPALWSHAGEEPLDCAGDVDAWLHAHWLPDPRRPEEVLAACRRARTLGDRARERDLLSGSIRQAIEDRRDDRLLLLAGPFGEDDFPASAADVRRRVSELAAELGPPWREADLLLSVTQALRPVSAEIAQQLLQELAEGDDREAALGAQLLRLDRIAGHRDERAHETALSSLEALVRRGEPWEAGYLDWAAAAHAFLGGRPAEAAEHARRGRERLDAHDGLRAGACALILAILRFREEPDAGLDDLETAEGLLPDPEERARACSNLAIMHLMRNDLERAQAAVERGLEALSGRPASVWRIVLEGRRTWILIELGKLGQALGAAQRLLEDWGARQLPAQRALAHLASGVCSHYREGSPASLSELARVWAEARQRVPHAILLSALRYLCDALLDLEAWDLVRAYGGALRADLEEGDAAGRLIAARIDALRAQAQGRPQEALELLSGLDLGPPGGLMVEERCWSILHRASARLAAGRARLEAPGSRGATKESTREAVEAAEELAAAEQLFAAQGRPYPRERARMERVRALAAAGLHQEAREAIDACVAGLRETEFQGLLARALRLRAEIALGMLAQEP